MNTWIQGLSEQLSNPDSLLIGLILVAIIVLSLMLGLVLLSRSKNKLRTRFNALVSDYKEQEGFLHSQRLSLEQQQESVRQLNDSLDQAQSEVRQLAETNAANNTRLQMLDEQAKTQEQEKAQSQQMLEARFNQLADQIFSKQITQAKNQQQESLELTLKPFTQELGNFKKKVEEVYDKDLRDRISLTTEIEHLKKINLQISDDAVRLTQALRGDNKIQGNWGEMILERVLNESGLRKGHEYLSQPQFKTNQGDKLIPDVLVQLPDNKAIVIDSKVSLISYEQYVGAEDESERLQASKAFAQSIKQHIASLSSKAYDKVEGLHSLDFVFLFVPIESAFQLALEQDTQVFRQAFEKHIVLVSPSTLFASLRTVEHLWRYERQNKNAEEIARQAANLHDKLVLFSQSLTEVGNALTKAANMHDKAIQQFSQGRGNIVDRVNRLKTMGVPTKKEFSAELLEASSKPDSIAHEQNNIEPIDTNKTS